MAVPPPQPVPGRVTRAAAAAATDTKPGVSGKTQNLAVPSSSKAGTSPGSYGAMTGISFTNGGGFSIENKPRSVKWGATTGGAAGSYGAKYHIDGCVPLFPSSSADFWDLLWSANGGGEHDLTPSVLTRQTSLPRRSPWTRGHSLLPRPHFTSRLPCPLRCLAAHTHRPSPVAEIPMGFPPLSPPCP